MADLNQSAPLVTQLPSPNSPNRSEHLETMPGASSMTSGIAAPAILRPQNKNMRDPRFQMTAL